jgi:hypothetical protein
MLLFKLFGGREKVEEKGLVVAPHKSLERWKEKVNGMMKSVVGSRKDP